MPYIQAEHLCIQATTGCDWAGHPFSLEAWDLILSPLLIKKQLSLGFLGLGIFFFFLLFLLLTASKNSSSRLEGRNGPEQYSEAEVPASNQLIMFLWD